MCYDETKNEKALNFLKNYAIMKVTIILFEKQEFSEIPTVAL